MNTVFYISAAIAVIATVMVLTRYNPVHALLYMVVSLLAVALVFFTLGAPFVAALEVIVYAGAIMVLFVFVIMMLNLGPQTVRQEKAWLPPKTWRGPAVLASVLLAEIVFIVGKLEPVPEALVVVGPEKVGGLLFGPYLLAVELAAMLLLAGMVGAYHLARRVDDA